MTWITNLKVSFCKKVTNSPQNDNDFFSSNNYIVEEEKKETLAREVPVALVYNGISHTVMMCSPHQLTDFAIGFSLAEGIIQHPSEIYSLEVQEKAQGIEVHIELSSRRFMQLKQHRRSLAGRTGCGICGTEQLNQVYKNLPKLDRTLQVELRLFDSCLQQLEQAQQLGQQTGATHACGFFDPQGKLLAIREDVGRHVALDKLLGWHAQHQQPKGFILTTSRASYEMVQKTVSCHIEMLVAISAVTDLAVQMAQQSNLTLVGFTRPKRATIYCGKVRLVF